MSLTNPNTPVSQQDLQDFYHKLLPYMGGSFGLVATGIDSANLYSTTERVIGQWIDGKPLYQKTIHFGNGTTTNTYKHIAHGITNIDTIVKTEGLDIHNDSEGNGGSMPWVDRTDYIAFMWADKTNINLSTNYDSSAIDYYMTIQYTKTTDSAVESYGTDTTYSTDEHVVGSWIDGKPVYQKTITGTLPTITRQEMYDNTLKRTWVSIGASIDAVIDVKGFAYVKENDASHALKSPIVMTPLTNNLIIKDNNGIYSQGQGIMVFTNRDADHPNSLRVENHNTYFSDMPFMATLQYTKTTD